MKAIIIFQNVLIGVALLLLGFIPVAVDIFNMDFETRGIFYTVSFGAVFLVMIIRPLADIFTHQLWLRRLVLLRKGFGILSASIIIGFLFASITDPESTYLTSLFTMSFYSFDRYIFFAHIGDITGFILLITSNTFSQRLLRQNWKRIQKLSYVYFYAGGIYEIFALDSTFALYAVILATNIIVLAWGVKIFRKTFEDTEGDRRKGEMIYSK